MSRIFRVEILPDVHLVPEVVSQDVLDPVQVLARHKASILRDVIVVVKDTVMVHVAERVVVHLNNLRHGIRKLNQSSKIF